MTSSQIHHQHLGEDIIDASVHCAGVRNCGSSVRRVEYLADQAIIGKASITTRLTEKSNTDVQALAFFHLE